MGKLISTHTDNATEAGSFDRWVARKILSIIGNPALAFVLHDGSTVTIGDGQTSLRLLIHDRPALWLLAINPELYFGELYSEGRIDLEGGLSEFLNTANRALTARKSPVVSGLIYSWVKQLFINNSLDTARHNIHQHYDIGNAFYEKWLDREMQYTCAYFAAPDCTLEQAQIAKMDHVCRKLRLEPGQSVVEAGFGWGGLARHMARKYGVRVKAYNISHEQVAYARQRAKNEGLDEQVEYIEDDYRNIRGEFDVFVSVGMLEHVGTRNYKVLGRVINSCLKEKGMGLIHTIGRNRPGYMNPWIAKRIFPGACPPAISEMMNIFESENLSVLDIENLRLHYATTLEHWLSRFNDNIGQIREKYDEKFIRAWRLYLCGSISAFTTGRLQLYQVVFTPGENNNLPWSRAHLYDSHQ
ncbi:MAG: class I SAM-dependent methyltransferase [Gammaproteobacteria bacterium]|nr:methyltransferase domain-containing protein [Gammaproteobacteria bacterium]NIN62166.1 methyltransferase domain-containing protein [Gammaproteobacteria bacterium]NIO61904.1 methyltransferase domain-containing protein [Gammaproteobacteria bacterium]NIP49058.1 class I SAM-dependent methyltransferase [Gammaproteobacteria bacterium]NIQ09514.1 class I SAM-dependent methyltransferase [Gammaproteobacteria bacterium]